MKVWYMNGAGNDFAVVDARNMSFDMSNMAKELCEKQDCDGFMALDSSNIADFRLHFYNRDGSRAEMCGNGARCICRFAYDNGIAGEKMTVETDAGELCGERVSDNVYSVKLNTPQNIVLDKREGVDYAVVGVPHAVIELKNIGLYRRDELFKWARDLREELDANVNFYSVIDRNTVEILTYERGVEDFTLACGTGSGAVTTVLWCRGERDSSVLNVENQGGTLKVTVKAENNSISALYLEGNADVDGIYEY